LKETGCWPALRDYALPLDEVHVWRIKLDCSKPQPEAFNGVLSGEEKQRAERFQFSIDRVRHVVGRSVLRAILARCMKINADQLRFEYGAFGKPLLATASTEIPLQFNVSHSGELILIAITMGRAVGIDVERVRNDIEAETIAASFFSPHERRAWQSVPAPLRVHAFFDCWTRKEAFAKATGKGLSLRLDQFDVSFLPGQESRLMATGPNPGEAQRWVVQPLDVGPDYRAAVVVEGAGWQVKIRDWPMGPMD
jgi:4'-phosphopantetheinyl transferase